MWGEVMGGVRIEHMISVLDTQPYCKKFKKNGMEILVFFGTEILKSIYIFGINFP